MNKNLCLIMLLFSSYYGISQVGIGTTNPQAQLDVSGGNVRFSNYGTGSVPGTPIYLLGVESDGDLVEVSPNAIGLQYYIWDLGTPTSKPDIDNKRTMGISTSQGVLNGNLDNATKAVLAPAPDGYILHFVGTLIVNNPGSFTFNARSDDGTRIYIDNVLVVENWFDQGVATVSNSITLSKGEHRIEFWYYEYHSGDFMEFTWGANPDSYAVGSVINANQFFVK